MRERGRPARPYSAPRTSQRPSTREPVKHFLTPIDEKKEEIGRRRNWFRNQLRRRTMTATCTMPKSGV